jgi:hypothetical protein
MIFQKRINKNNPSADGGSDRGKKPTGSMVAPSEYQKNKLGHNGEKCPSLN